MKKNLVLIYCLTFLAINSFAQPGEWIWIRGSNMPYNGGNHGTIGVSSPANDPPSLYESCEWTDLNGNFWLYGGTDGSQSVHNDLFEFNPTSGEWTWMSGTNTVNDPGNYGTQGVASPTNLPPARGYGFASWTDLNNNLWLFGGDKYIGGALCDLWKYDISTNEWTWMKGPNITNQAGVYGTQGVPDPANYPGSRWETGAAWTDNAGDLWLFGGYNGGTANDLWRYNIASNQWTWMKGSTLSNQPGVYGVQGVEDPANTPGAREVHCRWKDNSGNLWLFGGMEYNSQIIYNDLWRFNPLTGNWTWMKGDSTGGSAGLYGTTCVTTNANEPAARFESRAAWTDVNGDLWMFGGGLSFLEDNQANDLWKYCIASNEWTWIKGDSTSNNSGNWGTMGVSSPSNKPNGRGGSNAWTDGVGHLYLFGGTGPVLGSIVPYNDLWKFTIDPSCASNCTVVPVALFTAPNHVCPGTCIDFTNLSTNATSYLWTFQGATPSTSTDVNPTNVCYSTTGTYDVVLIANSANGSDTITLANYITVYPSPPPQSILQNGDTLFALTGAASYQWYYDGTLVNGATNYFYVAQASGNYNVVATDANGCEVEAVIFDVVAVINSIDDQEILIFPNPVGDKVKIHKLKVKRETALEISIYNVIGEKMEIKILSIDKSNTDIELDVHALAAGLYYLEIKCAEKTFRSKFVKAASR